MTETYCYLVLYRTEFIEDRQKKLQTDFKIRKLCCKTYKKDEHGFSESEY